MAVQIPILSVKSQENGDPPTFWCLPTWYPLVASLNKQYDKVFVTTPCKKADECSMAPEAMRQFVEAQLRQIPVWGDKTLTLDALTIARNIQSEFGSGSPTERAAVGLAAVNRAAAAGSPSVTAHFTSKTNGTYGKQGASRPASTAQDASVSNLLLGRLIASGAVRDFTGGATHYFDRVTQDYMHQKKPDTNPAGEDLYLDWTGGGDFLTWLGHMPDVRSFRLALFKRRPDLKPVDDGNGTRAEKIAARAAIRDAGQKAVMGMSRSPAPWSTCIEAVAEAAKHQAGVSGAGSFGDPALSALEDREGVATAGFCIFMAGVAGTALGVIGASSSKPRRQLAGARRRR